MRQLRKPSADLPAKLNCTKDKTRRVNLLFYLKKSFWYNANVMAKKKIAKIFQYTAVLEPEKVGGYSVVIPALPGCISQGETFEEALKNIKEASELYLEDLKKEGEIPQEEKPIVVSPIQVTI